MDDGGAGSRKTPASSIRELRKAVKRKGEQIARQASGCGGGRGGGKNQKEVEESCGRTNGAGDEGGPKEEAVVAPAAKKLKILADGSGGFMEDATEGSGGFMEYAADGSGGSARNGSDGKEDWAVAVAPSLSVGKPTEMPKGGKKRKEVCRRARKEEVVVVSAAKKQKTLLDNQALKKASAAAKMTQSTVVAYTPEMPQRYASLLRNITFLLHCESRGNAYECTSDRIKTFLKWSGCDFCLFFEWLDKDRGMLCHMFNTLTGMHVTFLVNPGFSCEVLEIKVKSVALAFSSSFCCDEKWAALKDMLTAMFLPQEEDFSDAPDHLYVFTRIDDYLYMRIMKIDQIPAMDSSEDTFVLTEVGSSFGLKLLDIQGISDQAYDVSQNQIKPCMVLSATLCYSTPPDKQGPCIAHTVSLSGVSYMILLESGPNLSEFEGFNLSLGEFVSNESFIKIKKIIGSVRDEESTFVRNIAKRIIRSMLAEFSNLFASSKCIVQAETELLDLSNILLKGSSVKLFGVQIVGYDDIQARVNIVEIVSLIRRLFPEGQIPSDLEDLFSFLLEDPLNNLEAAKDNCDLYSAGERRELLVLLHTEYMTNVRPQITNRAEFFVNCPYLQTWMTTVEGNTYLQKSANLESKKVGLVLREVEKGKAGRSTRKMVATEGELQFSFMRNSHVHIAEKALKDGFKSFRLTWSDYILTASFRKYLAYIQKQMAPYLKSKGDPSRRQS